VTAFCSCPAAPPPPHSLPTRRSPDLLDFAAFWAKGRIDLPRLDRDRVLYADFRADPEAHPLPTPSGRIEITSATVASFGYDDCRSEEHTSELQSRENLVCRLLLAKKH